MVKTVLVNTIEALKSREEQNRKCEEMLRRCGLNTGNVCFADAMLSQLRCADVISRFDIGQYGEAVYVLPASNWINANGGVLHELFLPLENKDVKLAVIGLGIQGKMDDSSSNIVARLSKTSITALKILSEHSISIGVRGEITASVLEKLGIYNYRIIGCPSFYEPFRKTGGGKTEWKREFVAEKVVYGVTPSCNQYVHKELELAYEAQNEFILQAMSDMPLTLLENLDIEERHIARRFPDLKLTPYELMTYIRNKGRIFYTRRSWSEYLHKQDICFAWGSRFHGNMMAFSNGIPALWIMHDARTKELINTMKLSYVTHEQLMKIKSISELFDICKYDDGFENTYRELSLQYIDFLNENNIDHKFVVF